MSVRPRKPFLFPPSKPVDSSMLTKKIQSKEIYANYIIQQQGVEQGCKDTLGMENGGSGQGAIITDLVAGANFTTAAQRDAILTVTKCPGK